MSTTQQQYKILVYECGDMLRYIVDHLQAIVVIITTIIIIGTTAPFVPRPSSEASASCPYSLQDSCNFSPPTS